MARTKAWVAKNRERSNLYRREYSKQYRIRNHERLKLVRKAWIEANRDKRRISNRNSNRRHSEKLKIQSREWRKRNPIKRREYKRRYEKQRRTTDPNLRIRETLRGRVLSALKSNKIPKTQTTLALLGCDLNFLRAYLEARFLPGMTWENRGAGHGKWHLDHRIPCVSFDLTNPDQRRVCFHYSNLQPMWAEDNESKGTKLPLPHQGEFL